MGHAVDWSSSYPQRIPVGTHYRVWWFWLPLLFGCLALLSAAILLPIMKPAIGMVAVGISAACLLMALVAGIVIERGRRWVELGEDSFRLSDHNVSAEIHDAQVQDLATSRQLHHGAGKLLAETRNLIVWINTESGVQLIKLKSRIAPGAVDPLEPLIVRLCQRLESDARRQLASRESIDGDGWALDATQLHVDSRRQQRSIPLEDISAVETIGREIRIWQRDNPYAVATIPNSGRNGWLLERLLPQHISDRANQQRELTNRVEGVAHERVSQPGSPHASLGRVLFERRPGSAPILVFAVMGLLLGAIGTISLWVAVPARDPIMSAVAGILVLLCALCIAGGLRMRRVCFRCFEHGLERVTMTTGKLLPFDDIDVFSYETRRNQSHGRYTGTTYTLVCADRSREQGRGIFFSTTVRNQDEELDDLRERLSQIIARRMAQSFATHRSVQWTPEIWFRSDVLEYQRRRRLFAPGKTTVVPYDTITDFEVRDGLLHIWTSYQDRAILSVNAGAPNFYPGLILLEGLVRTWQHKRAPATV